MKIGKRMKEKMNYNYCENCMNCCCCQIRAMADWQNALVSIYIEPFTPSFFRYFVEYDLGENKKKFMRD
jgi:hypothetical protein